MTKRREMKLRRMGANWLDAQRIEIEYGIAKWRVYDAIRCRVLRARVDGPKSVFVAREDVERWLEAKMKDAIQAPAY